MGWSTDESGLISGSGEKLFFHTNYSSFPAGSTTYYLVGTGYITRGQNLRDILLETHLLLAAKYKLVELFLHPPTNVSSRNIS